MIRGIVEETLNAMLGAEAEQHCGAGRYERNQARQDGARTTSRKTFGLRPPSRLLKKSVAVWLME